MVQKAAILKNNCMVKNLSVSVAIKLAGYDEFYKEKIELYKHDLLTNILIRNWNNHKKNFQISMKVWGFSSINTRSCIAELYISGYGLAKH